MRVVTPEGAQRLDAALNAAGAPWQRVDVAVAAGKATITACGPADAAQPCFGAILTLTKGAPSLTWAATPSAPQGWQQVAAARLAGLDVHELSVEVAAGPQARIGVAAGGRDSSLADAEAGSATRAPQGYIIEAPQRRAAPAEQGPMRPADAIAPLEAVGVALLCAAVASLVAWRWRRGRGGRSGRLAAEAAPVGEEATAGDSGSVAWNQDEVAALAGARLRVATLSFGTFVAVSLGVYHCYPFYVFDMYSDVYDDANRIVAIDAQGVAHELDAYATLWCEGGPNSAWLTPPGCPQTQRYAARDRYAAGALRARTSATAAGVGAALEPVLIARRVWRFGAEGVEVQDCPLQRCRGAREAP